MGIFKAILDWFAFDETPRISGDPDRTLERIRADRRTEGEHLAGVAFERIDFSKPPLTLERFGASPDQLAGASDSSDLIRHMARRRADRNASQELIEAKEAEQRLPAADLVETAVSMASMPAVIETMRTIADRFELSVRASHELNQGLARFRDDIVVPLREELKSLKFGLVDQARASVTDLSVYVGKLDKILWAVLRAGGKTDAEIRAFREENGMQPEAPRGEELEAHMREFNGQRETIERLTAQNRRLLARLGGHMFHVGDSDWSWVQGCHCNVCLEETNRIVAAQQEAARDA